MQKLRNICGVESLECPSLEELKIIECPSLRKLPFDKDNVKKLKVVKVEQCWWEGVTCEILHPRVILGRSGGRGRGRGRGRRGFYFLLPF